MNSAPLDDPGAQLHVFETAYGTHVFVADGSRIYDVPPGEAERLDELTGLLLAADRPRHVSPRPIPPPPIQSLSLNVAQACNMSCGYCYAGKGTFGGDAKTMALDTAKASVDRLLIESAPGSDVVLGFMGGEPLLQRAVLHAVTRYADAAARAHGRRIRFSLTTNGTLLTADDVRLFGEFPFTVTISVDGPPAVHRRLRMLNDGGDSYGRLASRLALFDVHGRPRHLSARVTVTPLTGDLLPLLDHVIGMGFDEVGFSPVLVSPDPALAFSAEQFSSFLAQMVACGARTLERLCDGQVYPFSNFETAMQQIHRGTHRPYPCGAGAGYLSVDADGDLYACHRLIGDRSFDMGDVRTGPDNARRASLLRTAHVDLAEPCQRCWARYLCGGGCYHEVSRRGRVACDYIRGWLHFCLESYVQLLERRPDYFERQGTNGAGDER